MRISKLMLPVALLAGALALAGCGGGSDAPTTPNPPPPPPPPGGTPVTLESATTAVNACGTDACVDGVVTGAAGDLTAAELATLRSRADARKKEIADGTPLTGLNVSAANQLADALAGSEALQLGSRHINPANAEPRGNVPWKEHATAGLPGGWAGEGWREPNPEGSSGEEQDMRVWTENPKHISQKYEAFFSEINGIAFADRGVTAAPAPVNGAEGVVTLVDVNSAGFVDPGLREALPSNFFTSGWTYNADVFPDDTAQAGWELRGSFHGVPGKFVCSTSARCSMQEDDDGNLEAGSDFTKPSVPLTTTGTADGIRFVPSNFDSDETDVPALFAKLANPNFLSFGVYWTTVIDDDGDVTALRVDPFAGGGVKYDQIANIVQSGTGNLKANYSGSAAGTYVRTIVNDDNDREATGYGGFSADANLTAVFGTSEDKLTGTISDFVRRNDQASAGAAPHSSWKVELEGDIENNGSVTSDSFHAQFHGAVNTDAQSNGHRLAPYGLVGTFEHSFDSGYVAGAFGAECDGSNCVRND